jgi:hypothetical protein
MYSPQSLPRQCSEHQILMNEEINAWEAYDGLREALLNDPVPPELAEELDRRYDQATKASEKLSTTSSGVPCAENEQTSTLSTRNLLRCK